MQSVVQAGTSDAWPSPTFRSGPKRFAWDAQSEQWLGTRDGVELVGLLEQELRDTLPGFELDADGIRDEARE